MDLMKNIEIVKIKNNEKKDEKDLIIKETPFTILINNQEIVTLLCTPCNLEYLAIGFLAAEGLIKDMSQIKDINIGKNENYVNIEIEKNFLNSGSGPAGD
ncbi:MAG: formate dehydrogenase accessory sulfurtransferase FdhD, partial [bacterium]